MEEPIVYRTSIKRNCTADEFEKHIKEYQTMLAVFVFSTERRSHVIMETENKGRHCIATEKDDRILWGKL